MLLIVYGTRPEWHKIESIIPHLESLGHHAKYGILHVRQHTDLVKIQHRGVEIEDTGENRLNNIVSSVLQKLNFYNATHVMVMGDTTTAFAAALAAFHAQIPVIHLEAGLRTWDNKNPYPEEFNRTAISQIADLHLCPTELAVRNLVNSKVSGAVNVIGQTGLDYLEPVSPENKAVQHGKNVVITLHRRENASQMHDYFYMLRDLASNFTEYNFIFPMHPNPMVQEHRALLDGIHVVKPVSRSQMTKLLLRSSIVITDSGGVQEEASFLKKPAVICRQRTERPESLEQGHILCEGPRFLPNAFSQAYCNMDRMGDCPFGDGKSGIKAAMAIDRYIKGERR